MGDSEVPLPPKIERMLERICFEQDQPPPDLKARKILASIGEIQSIHMLNIISKTKIKTLTGFIKFLAKDYPSLASAEYISLKRPVSSLDDDSYHSPFPNHLVCSPSSTSQRARTNHLVSVSPYSNLENRTNSIAKKLAFSSPSTSERAISQQWLILIELEFRKSFLVLSYIGRKKLEGAISVNDAFEILQMKDLPMADFEERIWSIYSQHQFVGKESPDRIKYLDWGSGKTHQYFCQVYQDGSYSFKGPYLSTTRTHLQRALGDENVLIVKFEEEATDSSSFAVRSGNCNAAYFKIAEEGILIGQRRYRFFVFKDGGKEGKKKTPSSSSVKCYFVRMESIAPCDEKEPYVLSNKTLHEARCLFMHIHTTPSIAKYASRCSLILSKTIKLQVDLAFVRIQRIEDIACVDENGCLVYNEDGELLIHTDGTGYISEDLAMKCPRGFYNAKYNDNLKFEMKSSESLEMDAHVREPPLLMQCRLFYNGCAVKGTLLVNRKLPQGTIQIRPSMIKVEADSGLLNAQSFNSLEVIKISQKPKRTNLSKYLIALLSFGGVPKDFFLNLLTNALEDAQSVYSNKRAALRVALNHGDIDDDSTTARMILSGIPIDEPCIKHRLSRLANEERKGLQGGKLPIDESYYLMGTADPTGQLNSDQVCVILENGHLSGKVLVYRNPGLHFGDIHLLTAVYIEALEAFVGNAKYGIFFSTKGRRSVASEIATGDFDGDMYWVSKSPQLLKDFIPSTPWTRVHSTPKAFQRKPIEFSSDELEHVFFELFLNTKKQSVSMGMSADSWLAFMDRLLILGSDSASEKEHIIQKMLKLIDIYYDALDAPKTGKKVVVPNDLKAEKYPHYMERAKSYRSTSVLGLIYDEMKLRQTENLSIKDVEIWKLPCFEHVEIPDASLRLWRKRYDEYRQEMATALMTSEESKNRSADDVVKKYKQMLYNAADFEGSLRNTADIYNDAIAIYHVTYDYAKSRKDVGKCNFAWKVAGSALCQFHVMKQAQNPITCSPSVIRELLS